MDACTACSRAVDLISTRLLKRLREKSRCLVDQPLPGKTHAVAAEHGLRVVAVHYVTNPDFDAAIPKGLAAAVDFAGVEGGDGVIEGHFHLLISLSWSCCRTRSNEGVGVSGVGMGQRTTVLC
jgi:hypothetical protein